MLGIKQEPTVVINSLGEVVKAVIPVLILAEAVHWTDKLTAAVMFLISVAITSLTTIYSRSQTVTTDTANKQIAVALNSDPATTSVKDVVEATK